MNAFEKLLNLSDAEKKERGLEHTPREIAQQPEVWRKIPALLERHGARLGEFARKAGVHGDVRATIIMTGAGTSEFIGNAVAYGLRGLIDREVVSYPTTHLVTHAGATLVPSSRYLVISFARSGDSPESRAVYSWVRRNRPDAMQLVITCNENGALAAEAAADPNGYSIILPPETNDRSLVMTSSFSTLALTALGLGHLGDLAAFRRIVNEVADAADIVIKNYGDLLERVAAMDFDRAEFLGSNALYGTMQECHLKMMEITDGGVACRFDSFLGLRHGPQVFVHDKCLVVASLSSHDVVRKYEMDMLKQLKEGSQGCGILAICAKKDADLEAITPHIIELFPDGPAVPNTCRIMTDVVAGQILAVFKSLAVGLKPDTPSAGGTINRVVQGVTIYEETPA